MPASTTSATPDATATETFWEDEPYFDNAWHLSHATGINITAAWEHYSGDGVLISLLDSGFDHSDPELSPNYRPELSYDHHEGDNEIFPGGPGLHHGTMTALVAAGARNGEGGLGVAFGSDWAGQKVRFGDSDGIEQAFREGALNSDVFNNSWGFDGAYGGSYESRFYAENYENIIDQALMEGRDGLGTVIVFAAGNNYDPDGSTMPTHSMKVDEGTIAVGNYMQGGAMAPSSSQGAGILVSAPGTNVVIQHDGRVVAGGGTSAAAPVTSGVAALMLEANPDLGWRDVQEILALSSRYLHSDREGWETNGGGTWNGGGMTFSNSYGFGGVDAGAATALARNWLEQGVSGNQVEVTGASAGGYGNQVETDVAKEIDIQHVRITIDWASAGSPEGLQVGNADVAYKLVSPDGTESVFLSGQSSSGVDQFDYYTNAFWSESSAGTWTVKAVDMETGDEVNVPAESVSLTFMGDETSTSDQYFYTADFRKMLAEDASRGRLSDTVGSDDIINAAASPHPNVISLRDGYDSRISGGTLSIEGGIEHIIAGQGDDALFGNEAANTIFADFGDDRVLGGAGDDYLVGGGGDDYLQGGSGDDRIVGQDGHDAAVGGRGADTILGGDGNDTINGDDGDDLLFGWVGDDLIRGQDGNDRVLGNQGNDTLLGNAGNDRLWGRTGHDEISGGADDDMISSGGGHDTISGGAGNDRLDGGTWADRMAGGAGDDVYVVDNERDVVVERTGEGNDAIYFVGCGSHLVSENVETGRLMNMAGKSDLQGSSDDNSLWGNAFDNVLDGGAGSDTMAGGGGEDRFVFADTSGEIDFVTDFTPGEDVLDIADLLAGSGVGAWEAGDVILRQSNDHVVVSLSPEAFAGEAAENVDVVFLSDLQVSDLAQDDFIL
ncbi:S8 family serine peptidase [Salipiger mucosus]|uniref:Type I secretion target repeat protein n=1 Tax=Salipiger mucosus DSM 16094 TaxID=1123237 RepID=S9QWG6_9RHOB|nr:S8 family serine peptidase [Salipiger mucosus]EPX83958.1 type I secretion target repeat protein [Salipiger mucosus DSM 16094]